MNFHQIWEIASAPDNVPIVALLFLIPFYVWYAFRQAFANDRLIDKLSADPQLAKTEYRKTEPWNPKWEKEVHTWPYLLRIELVAAVLVTVLLMVWSITLNAPLEEPSNPNVTMNPAKAPWYFLGLQEMLVYFDPWIAGVIMPTFIIVGLMVVPYIDANPLGNGYYTYKQRRFAIWTFLFGFIGLWVLMICHRDIHPRPRMDVVLAGADVGRAAGGVRRQSKHGPGLRHQWVVAGPFDAGGECELRAHFGAHHFWNFSTGALFSGGWIFFAPAAVAHGIQQEDFQAHDAAADVYNRVVYSVDAEPADQDPAAARVSHQVRLGDAVVQYLAVDSTVDEPESKRAGAGSTLRRQSAGFGASATWSPLNYKEALGA